MHERVSVLVTIPHLGQVDYWPTHTYDSAPRIQDKEKGENHQEALE